MRSNHVGHVRYRHLCFVVQSQSDSSIVSGSRTHSAGTFSLDIVRLWVRNARLPARIPTLANLITVSCRVRFPRDFRSLRPAGADRSPGLTACL